MKELIEGISKQINEAIEIGSKIDFNNTSKRIDNVLVCGLGGSGIGGKIIGNLFRDELKIPFVTTNDYDIPAFVNENTLVIGSSYSGNTEETISAIKKAQFAKAEIVIISSGGTLTELAMNNNWNHIVVPGGQQPRAMLIYSLIQQIFILTKYKLIKLETSLELSSIIPFIDSNSNRIILEAKEVADFLFTKTPVIYSGVLLESLAVRFRQQLNENAKVLCWNHVFPEMTHNELVGWAGGSSNLAVLFINSNFDHKRSSHRWLVSRSVFEKKTNSIRELTNPGQTLLQELFYYIHLTDWISIKLAELKGVDYVEVNIISYLKDEMSKLDN